MIEEQFHLAAERSPRELAQMVQQRGAVLIARTMLVGSPEDMAKFESALAKL
jgi:hypothetical protein